MKINWQVFGMIAALAAIWILFTATTDGVFLSSRNLTLLSRQMAVAAILATGMVLVIVAGQIDLSVGAMAGLLGAVATLLCVKAGLPVALALLVTIAVGALLGMGQGAIVAKLDVPPFIVTLGGMLVYQGALLGLTRGVTYTPPESFRAVATTFLPAWAGWGLGVGIAAFCAWQLRKPGHRLRWGSLAVVALATTAVFQSYRGLPFPVLLMLLLAAVMWVLAAHTPVGRHLYAIGGNRDAAFYAGIPIQKRLVTAFALMGLIAAVAGIVLTARVGAASSDAGRMMELDAIAAAVIGGTSLMGGRGSVWGALVGAAVMASLDNGMSLMNTEAFWQPIIKGGILVAAVTADIRLRKRRG